MIEGLTLLAVLQRYLLEKEPETKADLLGELRKLVEDPSCRIVLKTE